MIVPVTVEVKTSETWLGKSCPLTVAVTGPLMKKIEAKTNLTGKSASVNLDVPSGSNRTFTVEVTDKNKIVLYTGETTQSLNPGTPVTVQIPMNRTKVPVTVEITPSGISSGESYPLTVTVKGEGMDEMKAETTFTGKNARIDLPAVPSGTNRTFTVEVKDKNGDVLSSGTATQSIVHGKAVTVSIPIVFISSRKDDAKMVLIPAGEFQMGDNFNEGFDGERPVHTVYLDAYYIDVYEVTNAQYAKFLNEYGENTDAAGYQLLRIDSSDCLIEMVGNTYTPKAGYENHPVIVVSWYGAAAYAQFYGKRLPTEAEWEKAARGGLVGKRYPLGDNITHDDANYWGTGGKDKWSATSPVGSFAPNGYGLYDLAGNVWEWCADEYASDYYSKSPKNNPKGPGVAITFKNNDFTNVSTRRVMRGGSWNYDPDYLRCANRDSIRVPAFALNDVGFRCSQDR
jgi:formylglycine-generating enzyme required for sulfatase activity